MKRQVYRGKQKTTKDAAMSLLVLLLGIALGAAAKWADLHAGFWTEITSGIALWILLAVAVALGSRSPIRGGLHTLLLLGGMAAAYYAAAELTGSVWSRDELIGGSIAALLSLFPGAAVWFAKGQSRQAWLIGFCVLAAQLGATLLLFQKLRVTDAVVIVLTAVLLFWNKAGALQGRRR